VPLSGAGRFTATEERDLAIRAALGSGRARLVRGIVIDAVVLAAGGGVLGSVAAWWGTSLVGAAFVGLPHLDLTPGAPVLAFSFLLVLATALAVGLLPALRLTGAGLVGSLKDQTRAGGRRTGRFHRWAVAAQVGVAVLCIAVSAVFVQSLSQLDRRDLGFDPDHLLVVSLDLSTQGYDDAARGLRFVDRVLEKARALPGVEAAAVADGLPVDLVGNFTRAARAEAGSPTRQPRGGADRPAPDSGVQAEFTRVGAGFFQAVGTRVLRGRGIEPSDTPTSPRVVVIGRRLAERLWPGEDALGRQIRLDSRSFGEEKGAMPYTVVGVTPDVASSRPAEDWPQLFVALAQHYGRPRFHLLVRGRADAAALTSSVQSAIRSIDPLFAWSAVTSRDLLARALNAQRSTALTAGGIGGAGLFLSAFGLYGLVAFVVAQRMREFGVRMALGATPGHILRATLGDGVRLALPGLVVGALAAAGTTLTMRSMLLGVAPLSPVAFGATSLLVLAIVLLACALPAARAARVDPAAALRSQ
jgi:putative ABC transport system permease protein